MSWDERESLLCVTLSANRFSHHGDFISLVFPVFTIAFGLGMEKVGAPSLGLYVLLGYGVYQCAVAVSLEVWGCLHTHLGDGRFTSR